MARHAFISHSHKDADASNAIVAALESRGVKCWTAPRDVTPGGSYAESIITAIENSSCFVLVYTQNSNVSPHVLREVERALALGINIIPLRFDDSSISKSLDYLLATVHWLSVIAQPRQTAIRDAADRIASCVIVPNESAPVVAPPPVSALAPPARPAEKTPVMLWLLLLLVGLAVIGLSIVTVRRLTSHNETSPPAVERPSPTPSPTVAVVESVPVTSAPTVASLPTATPEITATATAVPVVADISTPNPQPPAPVDEESAPANENAEPSPESTPTPEARPPPNDTPLAAVRRYYACLRDRNTIKAYELLSADYRSRETFVNYTRSFASTTALNLNNTRLISNNGSTASVTVTFRKNNQKFGWITWSGPVELVREDAGWRIESTKGLRATRGRK